MARLGKLLGLRRTARTVGRRVLMVAGLSLGAVVLATAAPDAAKSASAPVDDQTGHPSVYPGGVWEPGPAKYGSTTVDEVPVTMDDGIVLRASIAYPTDLTTGQRAAGKFPVVIEHTPYVRLREPVVPNTFLTEHGYIYAVVRARGLGTSGGEVQFFSPREGLDGKAIVDWAAHRLDGTDGRVGIIGCSYPGGIALTDTAYLGANSPVKAVIAACVGLDGPSRNAWMVSGLATTGFGNFPPRAPSLMGQSPASVKFFEQVGRDVWAGGDPAYNRSFWHDRQPLGLAPKIVDTGIPVLLWAGWRDIVDSAAIHTYTALQNAFDKRPPYAGMTRDQPTTPRYQIIMGDWEHAHGLDAGIYLEWIETWLKGVDTGIQKTNTPMHLFETGSDRWVNLSRYPVVSDYTRWYLGASNVLKAEAPSSSGEETLRFGDPSQPQGLLSFTMPPLVKGATLAGPISATIFASSTNTNLELIAKLYDIAPDGTAALVSKGALLGSLQALDPEKSWTDGNGTIIWPWPTLEKDAYLTPEQVYRFDIALAPRQWGVRPNHRLRFELTTQNPAEICPASGPPPVNGGDVCGLTTPQRATLPGGTYRVMFAPQFPSALNLPQLAAGAFPSAAASVPPTAWSEDMRRLDIPELTLPRDWASKE